MKVPNRPTPEGRELGENLARFTEIELARLRERFPVHAEPCGTCAFRRGTIPNGSLATVGDALKCAMEGVPFMCHESLGGNEGKPSRACVGWCILSGAASGRPVECPWPFSEE